MNENFEAQVSSIFQRGSRTKAMTEMKTTPVILVCIYNKNGTLITHDLLHAVFSTYGKILRVSNMTSLPPLDPYFRKNEGLEGFHRV
jgi:hypothetical protein